MGAPAANPHPVGSPAALAYTEGAKRVCATFAGVAECSAGSIMPVSGGGGTVIPAPAPPPDLPSAEWVKADIVSWLLAHGVHTTEVALRSLTKAELLSMVDDVLSVP